MAEIALYSCDIGTNTEFIRALAEMTGAQVTAALAKVGSVASVGKWELDVNPQTGASVCRRGIGYDRSLRAPLLERPHSESVTES